MSGYGSRDWLTGMISNPEHERFYKDNNDRMPEFAEHKGHVENNIISPANLALLVDWLRGEEACNEGTSMLSAFVVRSGRKPPRASRRALRYRTSWLSGPG